MTFTIIQTTNQNHILPNNPVEQIIQRDLIRPPSPFLRKLINSPFEKNHTKSANFIEILPKFKTEFSFKVKIYLIEIRNLSDKNKYPSDPTLLKQHRIIKNFACWRYTCVNYNTNNFWAKVKKKIGIKSQTVEIEVDRAKNLPRVSKHRPEAFQRRLENLEFQHPCYFYEHKRQSVKLLAGDNFLRVFGLEIESIYNFCN